MADGKRERGFTVVNIVGMGENMVEQYFKFLGKGEVPFAFTEGVATEDPITGKRKAGKARCTLELPPPGPEYEAASVTAEATTKESAQASVVLLANAELMSRGWFSEEKAHEAFVASISGQEGGGDARQRGSSAVVDKVMGIMTDLKKPTPVAPEPVPASSSGGDGGDGLAGATIDLSGSAGTGSAAGDGTGAGQTSGNSTASGARELLASITGALTGASSPPPSASQGNGLMLAASSEGPTQTSVAIHPSSAPLYNAGDSSTAAGTDEPSELRLRERKIPRMFVLMAIVECAMVLIFATVYLANKEDGLVYGTMILCSLFCVYFARNAIWTENQLDLYCFLIVRSILSAYIVITLIEEINATVTNEILAAPFILVNFSYIYLAYQIRKLYGWVLFKRKSASVMEASVYAQYQVLVATLKLGLLYGGAVGLSGSFVCITGCYYAFLVLSLIRLLGAICGALIGFAAARRVSDAHQAGPRLIRVFILWRLGELVASVLAFLALAFIDKPNLNKSWYHLLLFAVIDVALLVYSAISSNRLLRRRNEASAGALLDSASLEQPLMHGAGPNSSGH